MESNDKQEAINGNINKQIWSSEEKIPQLIKQECNEMVLESKNQQPYDYYLILDFEAQCEDNKRLDPQEIIEFPTLALNSKTLKVDHVFHTYVKPKVFPNLTAFCTQLTGIQQQNVDQGLYLEETIPLFHEFLKQTGIIDKKFIFVTCGDWDLLTCLRKESKYKSISIEPYFRSWVNIKKSYASFKGSPVRGMTDMLNGYRLKLAGRHHSGIDDWYECLFREIHCLLLFHSTNIAKVAQQLMADGAVLDINGKVKP